MAASAPQQCDVPASAAQFIEHLHDSGVLDLHEIESLLARFDGEWLDAQTLARVLTEAGKLTQYQAATLLQGRGKTLVLGDYLLLQQIGAGGMGQVFQARHRRMKRTVAVKILPEAMREKTDALKRFQRETEVVAKLAHPNIVAAYDAGEQDGIFYLVMEYVPGDDVANLVSKYGPLPLGRALSYTIQVARGLAHAHAQGVVHRDIKPANLLVDPQGTVKVLDLGLARLDSNLFDGSIDGLTQSGSLMGTIDFMSPEQALDTKTADARADIYSLGCTLFYLLTARRMYEGDTVLKRIMAHSEAPLPSLADLRSDATRELCAAFEKMVAKRPADRYQTMDEVSQALSACQTTLADDADVPALIVPSRVESQTRRVESSSDPTLAKIGPSATATQIDSQREGTRLPVRIIFLRAALYALLGVAAVAAAVTAIQFGWERPALVVSTSQPTAVRREPDPEPRATDQPAPAEPAAEPEATPEVEPPQVQPDVAPEPPAAPVVAQPEPSGDRPAKELFGTLGENSVGMEFVYLEPGEFEMGTPLSSVHRQVDEMPHRVRLTRGFHLGKHEVTQHQYTLVMGRNPSWFSPQGVGSVQVGGRDTSRFPVDSVSWGEAQEFCRKLSATSAEASAGRVYRLPTEAEWEYACRAGAKSAFHLGPAPTIREANFSGVDSAGKEPGLGRTTMVGYYPPNAWGLFDMHGNVWEWCADWRGPYTGDATDPQGPSDGEGRVVRGGSWLYIAFFCRSASRESFAPSARSFDGGFRVVCEPREP